MTTVDIRPLPVPTITPADRRLIDLECYLSAEAVELANRILLEPDEVVGVEMLGRLRETVSVVKLLRAILAEAGL